MTVAATLSFCAVYLRSRSSIHTNFVHSLASLREKIPVGGFASAPTSPQPQQQQQQQPWQVNPTPPTAAAEGGAADPPLGETCPSRSSWEGLEAEDDVAAGSSDILSQGSLTSSSQHKRPLATIPSIPEERSGPSSRTSASGEAEQDVIGHPGGTDQQHAAAAASGNTAEASKAAAGHDWVRWEGAERVPGQQHPSALEPAAAAGHASRFSDALRSSRASQFVRRAFTSWNSRDRRHWQQQQEQEHLQQQQMAAQQQQDAETKLQIQQEALQLQKLLQQQ